MLLCECLRHGAPCTIFETFLFADTLHVLQNLGGQSCMKLQCMIKGLSDESLRAHRAMDDCLALKIVMTNLAEGLGFKLPDLLRRFALSVQLEASAAQLSVVMEA